MFAPSKTSRDLETMLGSNTQSIELAITPGSPFMSFLEDAMSGTALDVDAALSTWEETGILAATQQIPSPRLAAQAQRFTAPYPRPGIVTELVMNAIEHGSNFGEFGEVKVRILYSPTGVLFVISDPGPGINLSTVEDAKQREDGRGNGLIQVKKAPALITFENLEGRSTTSVLYI